jgi:hypothetical protein
MDMRSQFSAQTLAEIFRDLYLYERSGVLSLTRAQVEKRVHFERGMILFAESPTPEENLGATLVHEGKVSAGALAEAADCLTSSAATLDLAWALVNRDLVGRATVAREVRALTERIVRSVFSWEDGSARFQEGHPPETFFETDIVSTAEMK